MGTKLRRVRDSKGLSQRELAEKMVSPSKPEGYSFQVVSNYEKPGAQISSDFLDAAAKVLDVPREEIMGDDPQTIKESSSEYRSEIHAEILTDEQLHEILERGAREFPKATAERQLRLMNTIFAIIAEIHERTARLEEIAKTAARKAVGEIERGGIVYGRKKK